MERRVRSSLNAALPPNHHPPSPARAPRTGSPPPPEKDGAACPLQAIPPIRHRSATSHTRNRSLAGEARLGHAGAARCGERGGWGARFAAALAPA